MHAEEIRVQGTVQGVGFRPTVWRLARECGITGHVLNDAGGVLIEAWGQSAAVETLARRLSDESPPLARIDAIERRILEAPGQAPDAFTIVASVDGKADTHVAADAATCPECLEDIRDPDNRRYRYPFTNCTHCGPRLSIVRAVPYDRANTSMASFPMCPDCQAEYDDPADRRFHAQPNACPCCGPKVWLEAADGAKLAHSDAVSAAAHMLREGRIVAIKGIGGFHLACDATNTEAVARLRRRKRRYTKALALMAQDIATVRRYANVSAAEAELLENPAAPIVVLDAAGRSLPEDVAPGQDTLGFMLPYTPLHHLLLDELEEPIVLTSGNLSDEPQVIDNDEARRRLGEIADYLLLNDRDIENRLDDSVVQVVHGEARLLRRARGYAPEPVSLPSGFEDADGILAMGGELKNTFCIVSKGRAIVSQHMGDMEYAAAQLDAEQNRSLYSRLYDFEPATIAMDRHPDYVPGQRARALHPEADVIGVQHHHAHLAACLVEHGVARDAGPVLGVILDGLGFGDRGELWGGEFLLADYASYERVAHFLPVPLPGGDRAMREPWRNAWAHLDTAFGWDAVAADWADLEAVRWLGEQPVDTLATMRARSLNCPDASSAGRLFDALAALLGLNQKRMSHEAEAAMALEALARPYMQHERAHAYPVAVSVGDSDLDPPVMSWRPLWEAVLGDLRNRHEAASIAARFHWGLGLAVSELAARLARDHGAASVVLSGGVFQNRELFDVTVRALEDHGVRVLAPGRLPANDGGLALGQAAVAAAQLRAQARPYGCTALRARRGAAAVPRGQAND